MPEIRIREATEADMPAVHALVYELAVFEKAPDAVITTPATFLMDFRNGLFQCQVAECEGLVVGMILYHLAYSTWKGKMLYLEDFVVTEAYRRLGVGQMLFDAFLEAGRKASCRLVKWQVLDWNEPAILFYKKNGSIIEKDWWNGKIIFDY